MEWYQNLVTHSFWTQQEITFPNSSGLTGSANIFEIIFLQVSHLDNSSIDEPTNLMEAGHVYVS